MKQFVKSLFFQVVNRVDSPAVILLYHRVTTIPLDPQRLAVTPDHFADHLDVLRKSYNLISFDEFFHLRVKRKTIPKKAVVLSFDDGYADNYLEALPILEQANAQAIFYIATAHLDSKLEFWWDNLERIFLEDRQLPPTLQLTHGSEEYFFSTATSLDKNNTYNALHPIIKNKRLVGREKLMDDLLQWSGLSREGRETHRFMTSAQLAIMAKSKAAVIGAHTHNHPKLSACDKKEKVHELQACRKILEKLTGTPIENFSYPFGTRDDYDHECIDICRQLGFKLVAANNHGSVHRWHSSFELPRVLVRDWNKELFATNMKAFFKS